MSFSCLSPGELCDLILVFFDPMGQALCKRTLNIVERLNEKHGDRLHFYLSKADEAGSESDRQVDTTPMPPINTGPQLTQGPNKCRDPVDG